MSTETEAKEATAERQPTFERSIDTTLLVDLLAKAPVGELVTYEQMNNAIGKTGQDNVMNCTVRRILLREHNRVLECVRGKGYRTAHPETVASGYVTEQRRRAHAACNKSMQALGTVHRESLRSDAAKREYDIKASLMGMLQHATSGKAEKRIAKAIEAMPASADASLLANAQTLEALK